MPGPYVALADLTYSPSIALSSLLLFTPFLDLIL